MYQRLITLQNTDSAGVIYFTQALQFCHEAYEQSLIDAGILLPDLIKQGIALPIIHADIDYFRPLRWFDRITLHLTAQQHNESTFFTHYQLFLDSSPDHKPAIKATLHHTSLEINAQKKISLPPEIIKWLKLYPS